MNLYELTSEQQQIEDLLIENGGELTPELEEIMMANAEAIATKVDGYGAILHRFEGMESACDAEIKRLQALKKVAKNSQSALKSRVLYIMQEKGLSKLDGATNKFSTRKSQSLDIDEAVLLSPYEERLEHFNDSLPAGVTAEFKVNKTEIKNAFKGTDILPAGCKMVENTSLIIR